MARCKFQLGEKYYNQVIVHAYVKRKKEKKRRGERKREVSK